MKSKTLDSKKLIALIVGAVVLLALPLVLPNYALLILSFWEIYIIAVSGLDLVFGYCGQISLGHAAFYAIGAYGSGMLHEYLGIPVFFTMIIAAFISAGVGALIAYPSSKLVFHFLSLASQAFGEIVYLLVSHPPRLVPGNYQGLFSHHINLFGFELDTYTSFYYFGLVCVLVFLVIKTFMVKSKTGRAFTAIRENSHAADGMGINVRKYKVIAFTVSAFYTAYAGAMYLHLTKFINPDTFVLKQSVMFLTMLLFGGSGCLLGPVLGSFVVLLVNEVLRALQDYQMFVYGVLLLIVVVAMPGGLYGEVMRLVNFIKGKATKKAEVK